MIPSWWTTAIDTRLSAQARNLNFLGFTVWSIILTFCNIINIDMATRTSIRICSSASGSRTPTLVYPAVRNRGYSTATTASTTLVSTDRSIPNPLTRIIRDSIKVHSSPWIWWAGKMESWHIDNWPGVSSAIHANVPNPPYRGILFERRSIWIKRGFHYFARDQSDIRRGEFKLPHWVWSILWMGCRETDIEKRGTDDS